MVKLMGILNITPDSFSDGGKYNSVETAYKQALSLIDQGANIIDIGAESSGPNSKDVTIEEEINRIKPVLKYFHEKNLHKTIDISIDTYKHEVAELGIKYGATIINDITGLRGNEKMAPIIANNPKVKVVIMYSKDPTARTSKTAIKYNDVIYTIKQFLKQQTSYAQKMGINKENIIIDPGMGAFISTIPEYSYEILNRLSELTKLDYPILVGTSRKSFLGGKLNTRDSKSLAADMIAIKNGASIIRTHNPSMYKALTN